MAAVRPFTPNLRQDERGGTVIIALALTLTIIYLSLFVVDLARAHYAIHGIQRAVDGAALAGATELGLSTETDADRWKNAKRAAIAALKLNPIFMVSNLPDVTKPAQRVGPTDACDTDGMSNFKWQIYDSGDVRIEMTRGVYDDAAGTFTSSESNTVCGDVSSPNAMQITVAVRNFPTIFGGVPPFQFAQLPPLTRTGLAAELGGN